MINAFSIEGCMRRSSFFLVYVDIEKVLKKEIWKSRNEAT